MLKMRKIWQIYSLNNLVKLEINWQQKLGTKLYLAKKLRYVLYRFKRLTRTIEIH